VTNSQGHDDRELIQYLLGALSESDTERLDELSIADDQFAAHLDAAEHDLVDAYVRGALSGDTLRRFETHYLSSPAGRAKVAFARALRKHPTESAAVVPVATGEGGPRAPRPLMQWGLAAAALVCLAAAGYLAAENGRLKRQLLDVRTGLEARQQQLEEQLQREQSANAETERELERVRQALAQRQAPAPLLAAFVLVPPTRGIGEIPALTIPRGSGAVSLQINLDADDFPTYRVALRDPAAGQIIWRNAALRSAARDGARALSIALDAALLQPRMYTVEVAGVRASGAAETVGNYPIRIVLE